MKKFLLLFTLISASLLSHSQDIYVVNNQNELKVVDQSFNVTNLFTIDVFQTGYLLDLAFSPAGDLYGVTNSWKLIKIDPDSASFTIIDTLPVNSVYTGMTCNSQNELVLCRWLQQELYKYELDSARFSLIEDSISSPGDFTYYKGNLIYPSFYNDYIKSYNGVSTKNIACAVPLLYSFVNVFDSCQGNTVYGIDEDSKVYLYDIDNGTYTQIADLLTQAGQINGAATQTEYMASQCPLEILNESNCPSTGIASISKNEFNLFPNPTSDQINVEIMDNEVYNVRLSDSSGRLIVEQRFVNRSTINISQLPKGVYIVTLEGKKVRTNKRLIKL